MATEPNETDDQPEEPKKSPENSAEDSEERTGLEQELEELLAQAVVDLDSLPLEEQVNRLKSDLHTAQEESANNLDASLRAQAEMANFRRRTDEDRISNAKYSNSRLIGNILPVLEELELAITHTEANAENNVSANGQLLEGIKLIQRKLTSVLESEGVAAIEAVGLMFNPVEHEAVGTEETTEIEAGYVTEILRPGFRLHDRIIRPAQVMVAMIPKDS
jgi:molecular chaperone GrpE